MTVRFTDEDIHKAVVEEEYAPSPFFHEEVYYLEDETTSTRIVAWSEDLAQMRRLFFRILKTFTPTVEVLLKVYVDEDENGENTIWDHYYADMEHDRLIRGVTDNEAFVFRDGGHQLCVRDLDTDEYIALDDHGLLFLYSEDPVYYGLFRECGFELREDEIIYMLPHYHSMLEDDACDRFIRGLGLELEPEDEEAPLS